MKHSLIVLSAVCLIAVSCKKDRVCSCKVTTNGSVATHTQTAGLSLIAGLPSILNASDTTTYQPYSTVNTVTKTYTKVSKSTMHGNCFSKSQEPINQTSNTTVPGIYTVTTVDAGTKTYDCTIK